MAYTGMGDIFIDALDFHRGMELDFSNNSINIENATDFCEKHRNYSIMVNFSDNLSPNLRSEAGHKDIEREIVTRFLDSVTLEDNLSFY